MLANATEFLVIGSGTGKLIVPNARPKSVANGGLRGVTQDVALFDAWANGFLFAEVKSRTNEVGGESKAKVVERIRELFASGAPRFVIAYSGHGSVDGSLIFKSDERINGEADPHQLLAPEEVLDMWQDRESRRYGHEGRILLLLIDACHSEHWTRLVSLSDDKSVAVQASALKCESAYDERKGGGLSRHLTGKLEEPWSLGYIVFMAFFLFLQFQKGAQLGVLGPLLFMSPVIFVRFLPHVWRTGLISLPKYIPSNLRPSQFALSVPELCLIALECCFFCNYYWRGGVSKASLLAGAILVTNFLCSLGFGIRAYLLWRPRSTPVFQGNASVWSDVLERPLNYGWDGHWLNFAVKVVGLVAFSYIFPLLYGMQKH